MSARDDANPKSLRAPVSLWLYPAALVRGVSMASFFVVHMIDVSRAHADGVSFWDAFRTMSASDAGNIMSGMGEVIAAILGIVITVASIIVQLAATRYTPRITTMFFRDRTNLVVMSFFV